MKIKIAQSAAGFWNYAPASAWHMLGLDYADEGFPSLALALAAARRDKTIPAGTEFKIPLCLSQTTLDRNGAVK